MNICGYCEEKFEGHVRGRVVPVFASLFGLEPTPLKSLSLPPKRKSPSMKYLRPNVVFEPLVDRWYAWPHLISPGTHAMNIVGRHLKIMASYIQAPQIHAAAVKNPKMKGGPFMDLGGKQVEEIKALRATTQQDQAELIALAEAITQLDTLLQTEAKGYSLHTLYARVPDLLKGLVELTYDLNDQPNFRFFERLLYQRFYRPEAQSLALWVTENDERPFVLSTPRLDAPDVLHLPLPFSSPAIDRLARMRHTPDDVEAVAQELGVSPAARARFETFFTDKAPVPYQPYTGDKVRMRYFGHACILIETRDVSILVDPVISYYGYQQEVARFSDADLPEKIDFVLITHNHQDHILFETLLPLRHRIQNIIVPQNGSGTLQDPSLKLMFEYAGFPQVRALGELETVTLADCKITGLPFTGEHADLDIRTKLCYRVEVEQFSMLFVADSCNIEPQLYAHVVRLTGPVDILFLGMECEGAPGSWLYGPLMRHTPARDKDNDRRLNGSNFERGRHLVDTFQPREVYVYAMGMEPWLEFISSIQYTDTSHPIVQSNLLIDSCVGEGRVAERLFGEKELLYGRRGMGG